MSYSSSSSPSASTATGPISGLYGTSSAASLKRTCDSCAASKVKCSGTQPCERCTLRGLDCFYRARKKRVSGKPNETNGDVSKRTKQPSPADELAVPDPKVHPILLDLKSQSERILQPYERRSWAVFFSLYKNYTAGCARFWFERQLARLERRLEKSNRIELLEMLRTWARGMDVDFEKVRHKFAICSKIIANPDTKGSKMVHCGWLHLHVDGNVTPCQGHTTRFRTPAEASHVPIESLFTGDPKVPRIKFVAAGKFPQDVASATVNAAFEQMFGWSQEALNKVIDTMGSGLLPWGGDMLCLVAPDEADVFAFMQICAINLSYKFLMNDKLEFPVIREVPSAQVISLATVHSAQPVPCLMKCVHRELLDAAGVSLEVTMTFEPLMSLDPPQTSSSSLASPVTPQRFENELPLADDKDICKSDGTVSSAADTFFFPDVDLNEADSAFVKDILDFARLNDEDL